jgi:hypothetical protein
VKIGVRQLHLGLDAPRSHDRQIRRRLDQIFEQRRLTDPGLPPYDQCAALTGTNRIEQPVEQRTFACPPT